jgi:N-formylglutamate amidohydrolase
MRVLRTIGLGLLLAVLGCSPNPPAPPAWPTMAAGALQGPFVPGQVYVGRNGYIEYRAGDLPIILSAPHGGGLAPASIPDRTYGTTTADANTIDLVTLLAQALARTSGGTPHVVICHLRRSKVDVNREIVEATQGNPDASQAWTEYHAFIDAASAASVASAGGGFYVDIHGHAHPAARVELGYLLDAADLARTDDDLNDGTVASRSSLRAIADGADAPFAVVLRGPGSIGAVLAARGYAAVPSPSIPSPGTDPYFSGGYSTHRHGSAHGGRVSAVQVESPFPGVRDTAANRAAFADALAEAIRTFLVTHAGFGLPSAVSSQ